MIHEEKLTTIADPSFRNKVLEAAFLYAKGILLGTIVNSNVNVKRFSQTVFKTIAGSNPVWLDGLAYFTLSTPANLPATATQTQINNEVTVAFPYYAKAEYGDIT